MVKKEFTHSYHSPLSWRTGRRLFYVAQRAYIEDANRYIVHTYSPGAPPCLHLFDVFFPSKEATAVNRHPLDRGHPYFRIGVPR